MFARVRQLFGGGAAAEGSWEDRLCGDNEYPEEDPQAFAASREDFFTIMEDYELGDEEELETTGAAAPAAPSSAAPAPASTETPQLATRKCCRRPDLTFWGHKVLLRMKSLFCMCGGIQALEE